jgi:putative salt-induced outer membrane protein YdiY
MGPKVLCLFLCCAGASSTLQADQVYLKNGDRLTGKIVSLTDGKMVLKSDLAGQVTLDMKSIMTFSSDAPVEIHLKDGTVLRQPVAAAEPNAFALKAAEPLQPQRFELANVASINPPPVPKAKWTGNVSGAAGLTSGNTKSNSVAASASLARRTEQDRTTIDGDIAKGSQTDRSTGISRTNEDWWRLRGEYDYFFTKKFFGFGNGRYEKDSIALLNRRVVVGGGVGYQWIEDAKTSFSTNLGLASLFTKYDNVAESNNQLSAQAGYTFSRQLWKNTKFLNDLTWYPSLSNPSSDYFLTSTAELRANLTKAMFANFKVIFNYDAAPAPDRGNTDIKYMLGVGVTF